MSGLVLKDEFIFNVSPFRQCHVSTIEETSDGLVALIRWKSRKTKT